jgi:hypothetical protein
MHSEHIFEGIHTLTDKHILHNNIVFKSDAKFWHFKLKKTRVEIIYERNKLISHLVSFFSLLSYFLYFIFWVNIQLNVHFYIFFQITIYNDGSLADGWTFYKRTNWASRKNIKYGLGDFSLLSIALVNCKHRSRIYVGV